MAEILSREKELFKINQELNLMTLSPAPDASHVVAQSRYATFLKQKGPSTLIKRKQNPDAAGSASARGHKPRTLKSPNKSHAPTPTTTPPLVEGKITPPILTKSGRLPDGWRVASAYKHGKAQAKYVNGQTGGRNDSTFTRKHKTATYVKYRNPKFTQSPSLEELLREGDAEETQQQVVQLEVTRQTRESTTVVNGQSKKQLTQDNFIRFLKAKVAILEEDHGLLAQDMTEQRERLNEAVEALRKAETQRDQAITSNGKLSEQLQRLELQSEEANRRQKERQLEASNHQRELELLKRDMKLLKQANANLEHRLARANEEAETARQLLNQQSSQKREDQELHRKALKARENRIKALKRQRADLLNAYKKQLFMIDNLKRQTSCVEQAVAVGFGEKEFNKVLEWNTSSKTVF